MTLAPDEVEIQATPRPGTAVAHHDGLVVVLDTALTPELRRRGRGARAGPSDPGPAREAALELDDRIDLWVRGLPDGVAAHLPSVAADTLAVLADGDPPADATSADVDLDGGRVAVALRRRAADR